MRQTIKTLFGIFPAILLLLQITSCDNNTKQDFEETGQYIPLAPDYSDKSMWFISENDTDGNGADIFYVVSTWETDWTAEDGLLTPTMKLRRRQIAERFADEIEELYTGHGA